MFDVGALDSARDLLDEVLARAPYLATAHLLAALIWHDLEDPEQARKSLDTALSIWANADAEYVYLQAAQALLARLEG